MGCSASHKDRRHREGYVKDNFRLPNTGLRFTDHQLQILNQKMSAMVKDNELDCITGDLTAKTHSIQRLVQRLLVGAAILDKRFASKFLVNLEPDVLAEEQDSIRLRYMIRLDALSSCSASLSYPDLKVIYSSSEHASVLPPGHAAVKLRGATLREWSDFVTPEGLLLREKIQRHLAGLLSFAAAGNVNMPPPYAVDESVVCASADKVVSANVLHSIFQLAPESHMFLVEGEDGLTFPDLRDFRIAIVEDNGGVRLRIRPISTFLGDECDADILIVIGIGLTQWPPGTDFPSRISLGHPDALLFYKAALTGSYLVSYPNSCPSFPSTVWGCWLPGAESLLRVREPHGSIQHNTRIVLQAILSLLRGIQATSPGFGLRVVSKYIMNTLILWELESHPYNQGILEVWSPKTFSKHVLRILDNLAYSLKMKHLRSYFFPNVNLLTSNIFEDDVRNDHEILNSYIIRLHEESMVNFDIYDGSNFKDIFQDTLICRWTDIVKDLPLRYVREKVHNDAALYNGKQLKYIKELFGSMLKFRQNVLKDSENSNKWHQGGLFLPPIAIQDDPIEDIIYLLSLILDQAKDHMLSEYKVGLNIKHHLKPPAQNRISPKRKQLLRYQYDASAAFYLSKIRRELSNAKHPFVVDDKSMVQMILDLLYRSSQMDRRHIGTLLDPYLNYLYKSSLEMSLMLYSNILPMGLSDRNEIKSYEIFCKMVADGVIAPGEGILDANNKGWSWAADLLQRMTQSDPYGLVLIFTPAAGKVLKYRLKGSGKIKYNTLSRKSSYPNFPPNKTATLPSSFKHMDLTKDWERSSSRNSTLYTNSPQSSPVTLLVEAQNKVYARDLQNLVRALVSINKFTVLQEAASVLPDDERLKMLSSVHKISRAVRRTSSKYIRRHSVACNNRAKGLAADSYTVTDSLAGRASVNSRSPTMNRGLNVTEGSLINPEASLLDICHSARLKDSIEHHGGVVGFTGRLGDLSNAQSLTLPSCNSYGSVKISPLYCYSDTSDDPPQWN